MSGIRPQLCTPNEPEFATDSWQNGFRCIYILIIYSRLFCEIRKNVRSMYGMAC